MVVGVAIALAVLSLVTAIALQVRAASRARAENDVIWRDGTPARATVVSIATAGGGINDHPRVDFELEVEVPGRPAYRTTTQALISLLAVPRIQPGCVIEVRISPTDPGRVVVSPALTPSGTRRTR